MRHLIIIFFALSLFTSCRQVGTKSNNATISDNNKIAQPVDKSNYAILKFNKSDKWLFENSRPVDLNSTEINEIEILLSACIKAYNPTQLKQFDKINKEHPEYRIDKSQFIIDLKRYKRQYIAVINKKGEKEVWINCFCERGSSNWRKEIVEVLDGGNCYFNLKINLTRKTYSDLRVNGEA
jgi:hypothetical protein